MADAERAPKIGDLIRYWLFRRFGVMGLVGLAVVAAAFFVWSQWASVKTWPGVATVATYFGREALPKADPRRFSVAVANLGGDTADARQKALILRLLREFEAVQVLGFDRAISVQGPVPEDQERAGHETARAYLRESGASVLIWGSILSHGGQTKPDLYLTAAEGDADKSKQYTVETGTAFRLPKVFWEDLSDVLRLVVTTQDAHFRAKDGHYVADRLTPFIARVRTLLSAGADRSGWDADDLASTWVILADALSTLGEQSGQSAPLEEAVAAYRAALKEWTRERVPLDWATTQNNLGTALETLGERESGTKRLEEAVAAYRAALKEWTRELVPLQWATTQNNLGAALSALGERESGTTRLEEAVEAFRAALEEWTRERVPLDWAMTQNNLGNALQTLGERESGTARLEEAVEAYREALSVFEAAGASHYISMARNNLAWVEALLAERRGP